MCDCQSTTCLSLHPPHQQQEEQEEEEEVCIWMPTRCLFLWRRVSRDLLRIT